MFMAKSAIRGFPAVIFCWVVFASIAADIELIVPEDSSPSLSKYRELGVPDPTRSWTASEYERALRVLDKLPREQLPRASGPSQLLFDRLVLSYRRGFELHDGSDPADDAKELPPPDLPALYSTRIEDSLLFDRELIAIRAETLSRTLETAPNRAELLAQLEGFSNLMKRTTSEAERVRVSEAIRRAEMAAERVSDLVRSQTSELLVLASIPQVTDPGRQLYLDRAQKLIPRLPAFLKAQDALWVANLLKGSAASPANESIAPGLLDLAKALQAAARENT